MSSKCWSCWMGTHIVTFPISRRDIEQLAVLVYYLNASAAVCIGEDLVKDRDRLSLQRIK